MYLRGVEEQQAAEHGGGDRPELGVRRPIDMLRARPLLPRYRLASGWAEIAYEWSTEDLLHAHLLCDEIDDRNPEG